MFYKEEVSARGKNLSWHNTLYKIWIMFHDKFVWDSLCSWEVERCTWEVERLIYNIVRQGRGLKVGHLVDTYMWGAVSEGVKERSPIKYLHVGVGLRGWKGGHLDT